MNLLNSHRPAKGRSSALGSPYVGVLVAVLILAVLALHPVLLWIAAAVLILGGAAAFLLQWYYRKVPVKIKDTEARSVLGLDEEEEKKRQ